MSEENKEASNEEVKDTLPQDKAPEVNPLQEQLDSMKADNERLNAKLSESNKHTKAAEKKQRDDQRSRDEAEGNYKELFQSSELERQKLLDENSEIKSSTAREKIGNEALKMAASMSEGYNTELLASFFKDRLKFDDGSVKVLDANGNLTVSSLDDLKKEFSSSGRFNSLISGSKSSGSGASGSNSQNGNTQTVSRSDFDAKSPLDKSKFIKDGGKVVNK